MICIFYAIYHNFRKDNNFLKVFDNPEVASRKKTDEHGTKTVKSLQVWIILVSYTAVIACADDSCVECFDAYRNRRISIDCFMQLCMQTMRKNLLN